MAELRSATLVVLWLLPWAAACLYTGDESELGRPEPAAHGRGTFRIEGEPVTVDYEWVGGRRVFEGDIVLGPEMEVHEEPGRASAPLLAEPARNLWPDGVVPYTIARSVTTPGRVLNAMAEWEDHTAIRFIPRTDEAAYFTIVEESGNTVCHSNVGYTGGRQYLYLRDTRISTACNLGVVVHEIGHVLGLWHEHTRADRDDYVRIIWANVGSRDAFTIHTTGVRMVGDYDITSSMHYRSFTLSSPHDQPSIVKLDGSLILHDWSTLSRKDIAVMAILYGSPDAPADAGGEAPTDAPPDAGSPPIEAMPGEPVARAAAVELPAAEPPSDPSLDDPSLDDASLDGTPPPTSGMVTGSCSAGWTTHDAPGGVLLVSTVLLVLRPRRRPRSPASCS